MGENRNYILPQSYTDYISLAQQFSATRNLVLEWKVTTLECFEVTAKE